MEPLVVTLVLDEATQARFEAERTELFPAGRTAVGAHLTLFHAVPGERLEQVLVDVADVTRQPPLELDVTEVMSLGRGVAYRLASPALDTLHRRLQRSWAPHLTRQDQQGLRAHVTVQNKVSAEVARATLARLRERFAPFAVRGEAVAVWRYVGGPWEPVRRLPFGPAGPRVTQTIRPTP